VALIPAYFPFTGVTLLTLNFNVSRIVRDVETVTHWYRLGYRFNDQAILQYELRVTLNCQVKLFDQGLIVTMGSHIRGNTTSYGETE